MMVLNGKTINDVIWIGNENFRIDINDFIKFSQNLNLEICKVDSVDLNTLPTYQPLFGIHYIKKRPLHHGSSHVINLHYDLIFVMTFTGNNP